MFVTPQYWLHEHHLNCESKTDWSSECSPYVEDTNYVEYEAQCSVYRRLVQ
jgi:hypothetical protein